MGVRSRILVLGGGSGGLELASQLAFRRDLDIVLVDRETAHVWKPRLHEMAAGTVQTSLAEMSFYLLGELRGFHFEQGEVVSIDREARTVRLAPMVDGEGRKLADARDLPYDLCVVALGGSTPDFGTAGVKANALRLDGPQDAEEFRRRFIALMVRARETGTPAEIGIVGTGPTGTELAAHLRHSEHGFLEPGVSASGAKLMSVTLIEAAPDLMPGIDDTLRREIVERLRALDVKIVTDAQVSEVTPTEIRTAKGEAWPSDLTVWATGLIGNPVLKTLGDFELDRKGRIVVDRWLRSATDRNVLAMGDSAAFTPEMADRPIPPTAQAASQQAAYLAKTLPELAKRRTVRAFEFENKGRLVSLGLAGTVGRARVSRRNDLFIDGRFATAAYHALERQHQIRVLGPVRGSLAIATDLLSPAKGPALKLHGE